MNNEKFSVLIVWGQQDSRRAESGEFKSMENGPLEYEFNTEKELNAFLYGIGEADGWSDYCVFESYDEKSFLIYERFIELEKEAIECDIHGDDIVDLVYSTVSEEFNIPKDEIEEIIIRAKETN